MNFASIIRDQAVKTVCSLWKESRAIHSGPVFWI